MYVVYRHVSTKPPEVAAQGIYFKKLCENFRKSRSKFRRELSPWKFPKALEKLFFGRSVNSSKLYFSVNKDNLKVVNLCDQDI